MAHRKVNILEKANNEVAHIAYFIESKGMPITAKKFVDRAYSFFERLGDPKIRHRPCSNLVWSAQGYRCATFRKRFVVAFVDNEDEIIIADFAVSRLLKTF
jgi:plasmid stabilization system protein ParE